MVFGIDGFVDANDSGDEGGKGQDIRRVMLGTGVVIEDVLAQSDDLLVLI